MQGYLDMLLSASFAVAEVVPHLVSGDGEKGGLRSRASHIEPHGQTVSPTPPTPHVPALCPRPFQSRCAWILPFLH